MGYFKEWIIKGDSPQKEPPQKESPQKEPSQKNQEKVIKNCPIYVNNIQKSNIKEDTKERIIHNCFMKDKKDNFVVEKIDSTPSPPKKYVYTDGACIHNGKKYAKAGIGIFFGPGDKRNVSERITGKQTNNAAELEAILRVFQILEKEIRKGDEYVVMTDSEYAIKCMGSYGYKLALKHWKRDLSCSKPTLISLSSMSVPIQAKKMHIVSAMNGRINWRLPLSKYIILIHRHIRCSTSRHSFMTRKWFRGWKRWLADDF